MLQICCVFAEESGSRSVSQRALPTLSTCIDVDSGRMPSHMGGASIITAFRCSLDHQQELLAADQLTCCYSDRLDDAILRRAYFVLHLHRFQDHENIAS